ncbi:unnamed protein product [Blepharisma stoltei]|uniref:Uncharacterized protein n=1 Tax=Blepharisma stoltei TaxID=1481888 RepID=A0AAU9JU88_9CILI|nr:unnamed protein product [Blepharisma stoltei]
MIIQLPKLLENTKCRPFAHHNFRHRRSNSPQSNYFNKGDKLRFESIPMENRPQEINDRPHTSFHNRRNNDRSSCKSVPRERASQIFSDTKPIRERESLGLLDKLSLYKHNDTLQEPSLAWLLCDYNKKQPKAKEKENNSSKEVFRLRNEKISLPSKYSTSNRDTPLKQRLKKAKNLLFSQKTVSNDENIKCYSLNIKKFTSDIKNTTFAKPSKHPEKSHTTIEIQTDLIGEDTVIHIPDCISESNSQEEDSPMHQYHPKYL